MRIYERGERRRCRAARKGGEGCRRSTDRGSFGRKKSEVSFLTLCSISKPIRKRRFLASWTPLHSLGPLDRAEERIQ